MGILCTFSGNYSILDYFNILFILDLNSKFKDFQIFESDTVMQMIYVRTFCGLLLRDFVT